MNRRDQPLKRAALLRRYLEHLQLAGSADAVLIADDHARYVEVNEAACALLGIPREELVGRSIWDVTPPQNLETARQMWRDFIATGAQSFEYTLKRADGREVPVGYRALANFLPGLHVSILHVVSSSREYAPLILDETRAEMSDLFEHAPCGYHSLGPDATILRMNQTELDWLGYTREEIVGRKKLPELLTPEGRQVFAKAFALFLERGWVENVELDMVRKDGGLLPALITASAVRDAHGNLLMSRATVFNLTTRRQAERELKLSEARLRTALQAARLGTFEVNQNELRLDERARELLGTDEQGQWLRNIHPDDRERVIPDWQALMDGQQTELAVEYRYRHPDHGERWLAVHAVVSEPGRVVGSIKDISLRRRTEEQTAEARRRAEQANLAKARFLVDMSHELRTPLNAILGFSELLAGTEGMTEHQRDYLSKINVGGQHLLRLIDDMLEMSRIDTGEVPVQTSSFNLRSLVREIQARHGSIGVTMDELPRHVYGDERKLRHIFTTMAREDPAIWRVRVEPAPNHRLRLISEWEPVPASGPGPSLGERIARLMGGTLTIEGDCLSLRVELEQPSEPEPPRTYRLKPTPEPLRALVVDDLETNRSLLSVMLRRQGIIVREASDGLHAVEEAEAWQPDVILMDIRMPVMDGYEASKRIKASRPVPIIAVTASALEDEEMLAAHGLDAFVRKPLRFHELWEAMQRVCPGIEFEVGP